MSRRKLPEDRPCKDCGESSPKVHFNYNRRGNRTPYCRGCETLRMARWRKDNPKRLESHYVTRYGLSIKEFNDLWVQQGGLCGICKKELHNPCKGTMLGGSKACIDHDHDSLAIRGLLCHTCNSCIGKLKDDPELLLSAIDWIMKTRKTLRLIS